MFRICGKAPNLTVSGDNAAKNPGINAVGGHTLIHFCIKFYISASTGYIVPTVHCPAPLDVFTVKVCGVVMFCPCLFCPKTILNIVWLVLLTR